MNAISALIATIAAVFLALPSVSLAQPRLVSVGTFQEPVYVTAAPGDKARLFVVERAGRIRLVRNGKLQSQPFLTIPDVTTGGAGGVGGLLSIAFPADYSTSGRFYTFYTDAAGIKIAEYRRATNSNRANASSRRIVLSIPLSPGMDHFGGQLQFAPGGNLLYVALGDGEPGDPNGRSQNLGQLFGKLLRINPRAEGGAPYTVPADNPYVGVTGARPEVWASGLRNPWRFSFDLATRDLVIGDVGEDRADEIDFASATTGQGRGANFGWNCFEGFEPYSGCSVSSHATPFMEKEFPSPPPDPFCRYSITGGYVARDASLSIKGRYVYGDYCSGEIRSVALTDPTSDLATGLGLARRELVSFGQDACGRLYVVSLNGPVYRIAEGAGSTCP